MNRSTAHTVADFLALRRNTALLLVMLVLAWAHWLAVVLGAFLFLAWSALSLPATFSVVATALDSHKHTMGIGVQLLRTVPRVGRSA